MLIKILPVLFVFAFLFSGCRESENAEKDETAYDKDASDTNNYDEEQNNDEEKSCCRFVNTAISSNKSGEIYVVGHTRDNGYDYNGYIKKKLNNEWIKVYECGGLGIECANGKQGIWMGKAGEVVVVGIICPLFLSESKWSKICEGDISINSNLSNVWGASSEDVFAVGYGYPTAGEIFHFNGTEWIKMEIPTESKLNGVWGTSSDNVYAVGENGTILHYDGEKWSKMESGTTEYLSDVWGSNKNDIYAVGEKIILHFNGEKWSTKMNDKESFFLGVHGSTFDSILAVGRTIAEIPEAVIFKYNGVNWQKYNTEIKSILFDVHALPDGSFYVVGDNDIIERITP